MTRLAPPLLALAVVLASPCWADDRPTVAPRERAGSWMLMLTSRAECSGQVDRAPTIHFDLSRSQCVRALYASGTAIDPSKVRHVFPEEAGGFPIILGSVGTTIRACGFDTRGTCTNTETGETANDLRDDSAQAAP